MNSCGPFRLTIRRLLLTSLLLLCAAFTCMYISQTLHEMVTDKESYVCKLRVNSFQQDYQTVLSNFTTPVGVPMILHFVYKETTILESYRKGLESCIRLNANWTVMLWTDDAVDSFISREFPQYKSVFYKFPHKIQRADAIRYLILYRLGGVYMDLDMTCRQPLMTSLSHIPCFLDRERQHQTQFLYGSDVSAMNSAMGCTPKHPFFKKVIHAVFEQSSQRAKGAFKFPQTIFVTTGPGMLTDIYTEWTASDSEPPVKLLSESYFSPYVNPRSQLYNTCRSMAAAGILARRRGSLTRSQAACLAVSRLGYELSDAKFVTNATVAIHQFTHLGYRDQQRTQGAFHVLKAYSGVLTYTNICLTDDASAKDS